LSGTERSGGAAGGREAIRAVPANIRAQPAAAYVTCQRHRRAATAAIRISPPVAKSASVIENGWLIVRIMPPATKAKGSSRGSLKRRNQERTQSSCASSANSQLLLGLQTEIRRRERIEYEREQWRVSLSNAPAKRAR